MVHARLLAHSGSERFEMGCRMFDAAREMILASLPKDPPSAELRARLYKRVYGEPLPIKEQ